MRTLSAATQHAMRVLRVLLMHYSSSTHARAAYGDSILKAWHARGWEPVKIVAIVAHDHRQRGDVLQSQQLQQVSTLVCKPGLQNAMAPLRSCASFLG
jgi:hypothetical protein